MKADPGKDHPLATRVDEVWAEIPAHLTHPELRKRAVRFAKRMDSLARLNVQSQEVYVDEAGFRALLKESVSPQTGDRLVSMLKSLPDSRFVSTAESGGKKQATLTTIGWLDLARRVKGPKSASDMPLKHLGLTASSTPEDFRAALQQHYPEIPDRVFELGPELENVLQSLVESLPSATAQPRKSSTGLQSPTSSINLGAIWDCLLKNLGWWGLVFAVAAIIAYLWFVSGCAVLVVAPPAAAACFWLAIGLGIALLGVGTFTIVFDCLKEEGLI
jgi:hypothetical protein